MCIQSALTEPKKHDAGAACVRMTRLRGSGARPEIPDEERLDVREWVRPRRIEPFAEAAEDLLEIAPERRHSDFVHIVLQILAQIWIALMVGTEAAARLLRAFAAHRRVLVEGTIATTRIVRRVQLALVADVFARTTV